MAVTDPQRLASEPTQEPSKSLAADVPAAATRLPAAALWIAIGLFLLLALRVFVYTPDDTFITFRYARNLAEGYGPVFNRGAPFSDRTEGYSCPLYMFLTALLWKLPLGLAPLLRAKLLGLSFALITLVVTQRLAKRLGMPVWAQALLPILLAAHSSFVVTSVNGMETVLMTLLVTLGTYLFLGEGQAEAGGGKAGLASAWVFAASALNRPEGILFGLAAGGLLLGGKWRRWSGRDARWFLAFVLPVAVFLLWRHWFYGLWLPNTYYAKQVALEEAIFDGGRYLLHTFFKGVSGQPILAALAVVWWALVIAGGISPRFQRPPGLIVPLLAAMQVVFVLKSGTDGMGGWRFMAAVVPLLLLLSAAGIEEIAQGLKRAAKGSGAALARGTVGLLGAALLALCLAGHLDYWQHASEGYRSWASAGFTLSERRLLRQAQLEMTLTAGDWLNANLPAGVTVAYSEMGVTPYLCPQLRFLDVQGLTDHGVATLPGALHNGSGVMDQYVTTLNVVGRYLMDVRKPDYILRGVRLPQDTPPDPSPILEGIYGFRTAIPLPDTTPGQHAFMMVWQRNPEPGTPR